MTNSGNNTPHNNPYAAASSAYGTAQEHDLSGFEIAAKLYDGMLRFIGQAKKAYEEDRIEDMVEYNIKATKILSALLSTLDFEKGGKAAVYLNDLYIEVFKRLTFILRADDVVAEFDYIRDLLSPVAKMWADHAENAKKANPDTHITAPEVPESLR
jgi:flagellar protein FliS